MYLPSTRPVDDLDVYINGDVSIDPSAVFAPGVIIQAAPNSQITIKAGVCVGMGVVLKAYGGTIEINEGAVLGAGVLVIGHVQVGSNACVGAATTILNASVEPSAVIAAGAIIGDLSRQAVSQAEVEADKPEEAELLDEQASSASAHHENSQSDQSPSPPTKSTVVGQVYVNNLLFTLFPERNSLNNRRKDEQ